MKEVYLIPGLGADKRVFDYIDLSSFSCTHLTWIDPLKNESIEQYAKRLCDQIKSPNPILVGVSFGGMLAIEIGKQLRTEKIILISSARSKVEIPWYTRLLGTFNLHKLVPTKFLKSPGKILYYMFGVAESSEKELLAGIVKDTDAVFLHWAIDKIVHWKNTVVPMNTILIHGLKDKLFPTHRGDINIEEGGHFMIVTKAALISKELKRILADR